jgi:hypothetical protein
MGGSYERFHEGFNISLYDAIVFYIFVHVLLSCSATLGVVYGSFQFHLPRFPFPRGGPQGPTPENASPHARSRSRISTPAYPPKSFIPPYHDTDVREIKKKKREKEKGRAGTRTQNHEIPL